MTRPHFAVARRRRHSRLDVCFYVPWIGALLAPGADLPAGGAETQIFLLSQALSAAGLRVGIVSFALPGVELPDRVGDVEVIVQRGARTTLPVLRTVDYLGTLIRTVGSLDAEVVVQRAAGTTTGLVGGITRLRGRRFLYSSANVIDFSYAQLEPRRRNVWLYEQGVRLAADVVVQTEEQAVMCRRQFGRDAIVINSLAEPAVPTTCEPEAFLWVGRLTHYKRPEAFVALARALPHARFEMVGVPSGHEGEQIAARLRAETAELANFELLDPRPRRELMALVERAVAMVNTADYEGMPNIFLEAWSRGIPALALSHDPGGVVKRHGLGCFAAGDPQAFARLADELWAKRTERAELSQRCLEYIADEHAPAVVAQQWMRVLSEAPH
jgi:glycosyltransferase involved in cell wall biosynthesis